MTHKDAIFEIASECSSILESLIAVCHALSNASYTTETPFVEADSSSPTAGIMDVRYRKIRQTKQRFNLFVNYSGALAVPDRRLDKRLEAYSDIKEMVIELLQMLQDNISCLHEIMQSPPPLIQDFGDSGEQMTDDDVWAAIDFALDQLFFLASAIRKSSVKSQSYDLSSQLALEEDRYFESQISLLMRLKFPYARRSLSEHLGSSIAYRRRLFFRRKLHEEKLRGHDVDSPHPGSEQSNLGERRSQLKPHTSRPLENPAQSGIQPKNQAPISTGTASHIRKSELGRRLRGGRTLSSVKSGPATQQPHVKYPDIPKAKDDEKEMPCPYCGAPIERNIPRRRWEKHVDKDVEPYVCLSEDCTSPFVLFSDKALWLAHMNSTHSRDWARRIHTTTWYCDVDHNGQELPFYDRHSFIEHFKDSENHPNRPDPTETQLQALMRIKQRVLLREDDSVCPFCDASFAHSSSSPETFNSHIADHLFSIAFYAIPDLEISSNTPSRSSSGDISSPSERKRLLGPGSLPRFPSGADLLDLDQTFSSTTSDDMLDKTYSSDPYVPLLDVQETSRTLWEDVGYDEYGISRREHREIPPGYTFDPSDPVLAHIWKCQSNPDNDPDNDEALSSLDNSISRMGRMHERLNANGAKLGIIEKVVKGLSQDLNEGNIKAVTNETIEEHVCNALHRFYASNPHFNPVNGGLKEPYTSTRQDDHDVKLPERNRMIVEAWHESLQDFDPSAENHVIECMRAGLGCLTPDEREKSQWIMSSPEISNWLRLDGSNVLSVRAECAPEGLCNPFSLTAAVLTATLQRSTDFPVLSFFCGLRMNESKKLDRVLCGPLAVLNSLNGQLLKHFSQKRPSVDLPLLQQEDKRLMKKSVEKPEYAVKLFRGLLELLGDDDVVFIILDSWSRLLGDRTEADEVIENLSQAMKDFPHLAIKILVLDPLQSDSIDESADSVLYVPEEIDGWKDDVSLSLLKASNEQRPPQGK